MKNTNQNQTIDATLLDHSIQIAIAWLTEPINCHLRAKGGMPSLQRKSIHDQAQAEDGIRQFAALNGLQLSTKLETEFNPRLAAQRWNEVEAIMRDLGRQARPEIRLSLDVAGPEHRSIGLWNPGRMPTPAPKKQPVKIEVWKPGKIAAKIAA